MSRPTRQTQPTKAGTLETLETPEKQENTRVTFEDIQQFEMDIGRAKFDPNEDTDGLPMMEVDAKIIEHVFKNAVNLKETPYVIYKDVKVYVRGSYAEVKAKEKIKPYSQGTLGTIPMDSHLQKGDGIHETYEGEVL